MIKNDFLSQLTKKDFLEFVNEYLDKCHEYKEKDVSIHYYASFEDNPITRGRVIFQLKNFFGKSIPEKRKEYQFGVFRFDESIASILYESLAFRSEQNNLWREFMTKKFGAEYVEAYAEYAKDYFARERKNIDELEDLFSSEQIELLKKIKSGE